MKKIFALTLALMLVFSLALTANAANLNVEGALKGATYNMYQMATVEQNATTGSILYYTTDAWKTFWNTDGATWFHCDKDGLVTINPDVTESQMPAAAKAAQAYAAKNKATIAAQATATAGNVENPTVTIAAGTGYYLMTSDKGSLCTLATITNDTTIKEKNAALPRIDKTVENAKNANAAIGDTVTFTLTVTTGENHNNEMNYIIHDKMSAGLTLDAGTIVVKHGENILTDYTVKTTGITDGCTFEIVFGNTLTTAAYDTITVTYTAVVNGTAGDTETNKAEIDDSESEVTVTTTGFTLKKTDGEGNELAGAKFELYYATTTGEGESATTTYTKVPVVLIDEKNNVYRPVVAEDQNQNGVAIEAGTATVKGLDPDVTYYVKETEAPTGYVMIEDYKVVANGEVTVVNVKGDELPETGGMGTTLFYTLGGMMVAAAAVLLVTKKRMSAM